MWTFLIGSQIPSAAGTTKNKNGKQELMSVNQVSMWRDIKTARMRMEGLESQEERSEEDI